MTDPKGWEVYWQMVRRIPRGKVATYGQIATMAGRPGRARQVGWALHALSEEGAEDVPWQRVVNARGEVSPRAEPGREGLQEALLREEGVEIDVRGRIDLRRFGWTGEPS